MGFGGVRSQYGFAGLILTFAVILQCTNSSPPLQSQQQGVSEPSSSSPYHHQQQQQRPKFSSRIPSQIPRRKTQTTSGTNNGQEYADFSTGFPSGFTQGLPTFDFSGPMAPAASSDGKGGEPATADTENIGFVHGPPDGFPTLEQLGGKFPGFPSMTHESPSGGNHGGDAPLQQYRPQFQQGSGSDDSYQTQHGGGPEEYPPHPGPGPGPVHHVIHDKVEHRRPPPQFKRPRPKQGFHSLSTSGSPQYLPHRSSHPIPYQGKRPIVIKVSGKKVFPTKLPPGPPVFYAPSPDVNRHSSQQDYRDAPQRQESFAPSNHHPQRLRYRRSTATTKKEDTKSAPDQVADGSSPPETFWEVSSPFILFDTYKAPEQQQNSVDGGSVKGVSGQGQTVADHESGEQRFFPSFPAPNPYLGLGFGGGPPARPPIFPGPSANRAPSRYHPQFGPTKYSLQQASPPNRGGVYSAESHDHDHYQDNNLLGSGNFEVIRGGTYYDDDDGYNGGFGHGHGHDDGDYYHHNGHSSPPGYRAPGTDFFANFRDFADINPPSRSYSHRHETLALHPAGAPRQLQPKNILEKLESSSDSISGGHGSESDPMMATY